MGASASQTGLGSAEAPEPHSRLGPTGAIPSADELLTALTGLVEANFAMAEKLGINTAKEIYENPDCAMARAIRALVRVQEAQQ